jgi:hypothetical protein
VDRFGISCAGTVFPAGLKRASKRPITAYPEHEGSSCCKAENVSKNKYQNSNFIAGNSRFRRTATKRIFSNLSRDGQKTTRWRAPVYTALQHYFII